MSSALSRLAFSPALALGASLSFSPMVAHAQQAASDSCKFGFDGHVIHRVVDSHDLVAFEIVDKVAPGSNAEKAGLRPGDKILTLGEVKIGLLPVDEMYSAFKAAVAACKPIEVGIGRESVPGNLLTTQIFKTILPLGGARQIPGNEI